MANNKKEFKPNEVINGTWGEIWIDGEYMANCTAFKANINIKTTAVPMCGNLTEGEKLTGLERKGELKLHKVNSVIMKKYVNAVKAGRLPECTIISKLEDPDSLGAERVACYGCTFDKIALADWEVGKVGEESYSFNFRDEKLLDTIE
mgnify:CR=1 FL=1